ncbi:MAG TPA: hypothetical protein VI758_04845 [Bacteroidota bacterium]
MDKDFRARVSAMSDESLLAIVEHKPDDYVSEALLIVNEEVARRGGVEFLKQKVLRSPAVSKTPSVSGELQPEMRDQSNEIIDRLKKLYPLLVIAAYFVFEYIIGGSLWLYWMCVFAMIGFWIRVMIKARTLTPEEEYKEIAEELAKHPESEDRPMNDQE